MARAAERPAFGELTGPGLREPSTAVPWWPRVWNYLVGGRDAFHADRELAADLERQIPGIARIAQMRRRARHRLVEGLVGAGAIEQLLVLGAEPPLTMPPLGEVHSVARRINPSARTVYVTGDPVAAVHVQALMCIDRSCGCVEAAVDDPAAALSGASRLLDLSRPVAVVLAGALEPLDDHEVEAWLHIAGTVLAPGSRLGISHLTGPTVLSVTLAQICGMHQAPLPHLRGPADVAALLCTGPSEEPRAFAEPFPGMGPDPAAGPADGLAVWCGTVQIGGVPHDRSICGAASGDSLGGQPVGRAMTSGALR
ncbi:SAM-dependent methyltransferase [Actinomadura sp. 6K520]|uniref:SAM-dependent methyltransferase n=1 Tax=Actinomadura sp. 6K520 TaxID=2530364 RepID=UPI002441FEAA|nr:SAM-dependent methyltransferase [Actinomadura sp. 6K520]